jgi:hypothetical protein
MDLTVQTQTFGGGDYTWLGSAHGTQAGRSVTLHTAAFTAGTHAPNGFYPSGLPLGKITASGFYGPYTPGAVDGTAVLAGFLLGDVRVSATSSDVQGALLEHGTVIAAKVPIIVIDATAMATNVHFIYR